MSNLIKLTRIEDRTPILVNMDNVTAVFKYKDYTRLTFVDPYGYTEVCEGLEQIMRLSERENNE